MMAGLVSIQMDRIIHWTEAREGGKKRKRELWADDVGDKMMMNASPILNNLHRSDGRNVHDGRLDIDKVPWIVMIM